MSFVIWREDLAKKCLSCLTKQMENVLHVCYDWAWCSESDVSMPRLVYDLVVFTLSNNFFLVNFLISWFGWLQHCARFSSMAFMCAVSWNGTHYCLPTSTWNILCARKTFWEVMDYKKKLKMLAVLYLVQVLLCRAAAAKDKLLMLESFLSTPVMHVNVSTATSSMKIEPENSNFDSSAVKSAL